MKPLPEPMTAVLAKLLLAARQYGEDPQVATENAVAYAAASYALELLMNHTKDPRNDSAKYTDAVRVLFLKALEGAPIRDQERDFIEHLLTGKKIGN